MCCMRPPVKRLCERPRSWPLNDPPIYKWQLYRFCQFAGLYRRSKLPRLMRLKSLAGAEGFEPPGRSSRPPVFKTGAISRTLPHSHKRVCLNKSFFYIKLFFTNRTNIQNLYTFNYSSNSVPLLMSYYNFFSIG